MKKFEYAIDLIKTTQSIISEEILDSLNKRGADGRELVALGEDHGYQRFLCD